MSHTPVGEHPTAVLSDGDNIWVSNTFGNSLTRLSPAGQVLDTLPVGKGPGALAFDGEHLWVAITGLDPSTEDPPQGSLMKMTTAGDVVGEFPAGRWPVALTSDGESVWVANFVDRTVMRFDLDGNVTSEVELDFAPTALALVGEQLWVAGASGGFAPSGAVAVLSPTLESIARYTVGRALMSLAFDGEAVWVADLEGGVLIRMTLDGATLATVEVPAPTALTFDGARIWVASGGWLTAVSLDGDVSQVLRTLRNHAGIAWDGHAIWTADPANLFSGAVTAGNVTRVAARDAESR